MRGAAIVWCGNDEVRTKVGSLNGRLESAWAPGLIFDERPFPDAEISVFSFGMAHKVRTDLFRRLRDLLELSGRSYALYMSNASHETATLEDEQVVFDEMRAIFPAALYFLGHISDVAVYNYLRATTFYAAFFRGRRTLEQLLGRLGDGVRRRRDHEPRRELAGLSAASRQRHRPESL